VADAGYVGYALMAALQAAGLAFLLRLSSRAPWYVPDKATLKNYSEGLVYYWPYKVQQEDLPPLVVRLWRVRGAKGDVWLITNVLDEHRLPRGPPASSTAGDGEMRDFLESISGRWAR
jgi:hypothetical protein